MAAEANRRGGGVEAELNGMRRVEVKVGTGVSGLVIKTFSFLVAVV